MTAGALLRAAAAPALCGAAYALGAAHGPWPAVAALAMALLACGALAAKRDLAIACFIGLGALLLAMGFGVVPGFTRWTLLGTGINTAKAVAGLSAALVFPSPLRWNARCTAIAAFTLAAVPLVALALGAVHWAPPALRTVLPFALGNLFTVIGEEWFFRRWIQQPLHTRIGGVLAWAVAAALFGAVHFAGGQQLMLLAALAGLGYGAVWWASGSIWASVLLHLMLNVLRMALFGAGAQ